MSHGKAHGVSAQTAMTADAPDHDVDAAHDPHRARLVSNAALRQYAAKNGVSTQQHPHEGESAKRVREMLTVLSHQTRGVRARLLNAGELKAADVETMRNSLESERTALMRGVMQLPGGSPLGVEAALLGDEVNDLLTRLDAVSRAQQAHVETAHEQAQGDQHDIFEQAEKTKGFCDIAPQGTSPCDLDPITRAEYRRSVTDAVARLQASWSQAVLDCRLAERFKAQPADSWQQQLGGVLLGLLFGVLGNTAVSLASKGITKASSALGTTERVLGVGEVTTPGLTTGEMKFANTVVAKTVPGVQAAAQADMKLSLTTAKLAAMGQQAVTIPADRQSFLDSLGQMPLTWRETIAGGISDLFDADLAALQVSLPAKAATMKSDVFAKKINALLQRYEEQVLAVDTAPITECRPVQVMMPHGVRTALAVPEKATKASMAGEWKDSPVRTGKWTFLRWVDDDMKDMAMGRAIQQDSSSAYNAIATAGTMHGYSDASFWSVASLVQLAGQTGFRPARPADVTI